MLQHWFLHSRKGYRIINVKCLPVILVERSIEQKSLWQIWISPYLINNSFNNFQSKSATVLKGSTVYIRSVIHLIFHKLLEQVAMSPMDSIPCFQGARRLGIALTSVRNTSSFCNEKASVGSSLRVIEDGMVLRDEKQNELQFNWK
ncbi:hypothetical protein JHK86_002677 [Glycine max]|nr:hypothetical protein JHK86_002677 [Glycine max]